MSDNQSDKLNILERIVEKKREDLEEQKRILPLSDLQRRIPDLPPARDFKRVLSEKACAIIAEVKRSSPSKGRLTDDFQPVAQALLYEQSGAAAISVLTERHFFEGDDRYLTEIKGAVRIPVLRKDFIIDPYQIYEARVIGADAVLLIAALLDETRLRDFVGIASDLGLAQLVEAHDRHEVSKAVGAGAQVIGVNNRNLRTFVTDLQTTIGLLPFIPKGTTVVSESGIHTRRDMEVLMQSGVRAFLIGEALMRSENTANTMRGLLGE